MEGRIRTEFEGLRATLGDRLVSTHAFAHADGSDLFCFPRGTVVALAADAPVAPQLLNGDPLRCTATCRIRGLQVSEANDAMLESRQQTLAEALKAAGPAPALYVGDEVPERDQAHWEPQMGASGTVGIYKSRQLPSKDSYRAAALLQNEEAQDYYLSVTSGLDQLSKEYYQRWRARLVDRKEPVTARQLLEDPSTVRLQALVRANAQRLLHRASETLQLAVPHAAYGQSVYALDAEFEAPRASLVDHLQLHNGVASAHDSVGFYHDAVLPSETVDRRVAVALPDASVLLVRPGTVPALQGGFATRLPVSGSGVEAALNPLKASLEGALHLRPLYVVR